MSFYNESYPPNNEFRGGSLAPLQLFLIVSTCFLYLVSAGLFSKAVLLFELNKVRSPSTSGE